MRFQSLPAASLSKVSSPTLSLSLRELVPFFCQGQSTCHCQTRRDVFHASVDPGCVVCFEKVFRCWKTNTAGTVESPQPSTYPWQYLPTQFSTVFSDNINHHDVFGKKKVRFIVFLTFGM